MTEKQFIETYCNKCGTQRCEGIGTEWFEGCQHRWDLDGMNPSVEIKRLNDKVLELATKLVNALHKTDSTLNVYLDPNVEKLIDLFQSSRCKHWFRDNADMLELAQYLNNENVEIVKIGHWIKQTDGISYCSECGHDEVYTPAGTAVLGVHCPFCGAKMINEEND
jgi:hypothetical protein